MKIAGITVNRGSWDTWRIIRMAMGVLALIIGIKEGDWTMNFTGVFLMVHAYINACAACQSGNCELPPTKK